jgi:hypothetical protein
VSLWTNHNEIRIIGMSRSGSHAMIQWLMAQMHGRVCFLNCTEGKESPFASARPMEHGRAYRTTVRGFGLGAERAGCFAQKDWLIYNHEDAFLRHACSEVHEREHERWVGRSLVRRDLLIVRDPFNLWSARGTPCGCGNCVGRSSRSMPSWRSRRC